MRKLRFKFTCSDYVYHEHRWKWTAWVCGHAQFLLELRPAKFLITSTVYPHWRPWFCVQFPRRSSTTHGIVWYAICAVRGYRFVIQSRGWQRLVYGATDRILRSVPNNTVLELPGPMCGLGLRQFPPTVKRIYSPDGRFKDGNERRYDVCIMEAKSDPSIGMPPFIHFGHIFGERAATCHEKLTIGFRRSNCVVFSSECHSE